MRTTSVTSRLLAVVLLITFMSAQAFSQGRVNRYTSSTFTASYSSIIGQAGTSSGNCSNQDDGSYIGNILPFNFNFDSTVYSSGQTMSICSNGYLAFGSNGGPCCSDWVGSTTATSSILFMSYDMYLYSGPTVYWQTSGSAPNRVFTVEWPNFERCCGGATYCNVQVKLYETTNVIEMIYASHNLAIGGSAGIGLNGGTSPAFVYQRLSSGLSSTPSTDIRWTPPAPPALPTQLSLMPKTLDFQAVVSGDSLTLCATATCLGPNTLHIKGISLTGSADYTIASVGKPVGDSILVNQSAQYCIKFKPSISGLRNGQFTLTTDGRDSGTQVVNLQGVGAIAMVSYAFPAPNAYNTLFHRTPKRFGDTVTQYITVQSTGQAALRINSAYLQGLQSTMYQIVYLPPAAIQPGRTDSIGIRFQPYYEGRPDASLIINSNSINLPSDTVTFWGTGILGHLVITPQTGLTTVNQSGTLTFDSVAIGDSVAKTMALHNTGTDTVTLLKQIVTYGDYDYTFYPIKGAATKLAPDATQLLTVVFKPIANGNRMASIRFYTNISMTYPDNRDTSQFLMSVTGTGVPYGVLGITGVSADSALIDSTNCITQTIRNIGRADLTVNSASIGGPNPSVYSMNVPVPFTLAPGGTKVVTVCFTPTTRGVQSNFIALTGTSSGKTVALTAPITGVGLQACVNSAPSPVLFGSPALPGMTLAKKETNDTCITVMNCGDVPATYTAALATGSSGTYTVRPPYQIGPIPPNGTGTFCVGFQPDTIGPATGSVVISTEDKTNAPKSVTLAGVGAGVVLVPSGQPASTMAWTKSTFTITLQNTGNTAWAPGTANIGGADAANFKVTTPPPASINAGMSGTMQVEFSPNAVRTFTANLDFPGIPAPLVGLPYVLTASATQNAGVTMKTEQDGFTLGASYPNPASKVANVVVTTPRAAHAVVVLTNAEGTVLRTAFTGELAQGENVITLDAGTLPSGTYFYSLTSGAVHLTRVLMLVK